jgi:hypothetical protein
MFHCQARRAMQAWLSMRGWIAPTGRLVLLATLLLALAAPAAHAETPSPITLEELLANPLSGQGGPVNGTIQCDPTGNSTITFSTSGLAFGTYPGSFSESGQVTFGPSSFEVPAAVTGFQATFTIDSGTTHITGTKTLDFGSAFCRNVPGNQQTSIAVVAPYTATIQTPSGTFHDRGTTHVTLFLREDLPGENIFQQFMASDLTAVEPEMPTTKEVCKNGGYMTFPALGFKSQGDCVSFVATGGTNEPGQNIPGVP